MGLDLTARQVGILERRLRRARGLREYQRLLVVDAAGCPWYPPSYPADLW